MANFSIGMTLAHCEVANGKPHFVGKRGEVIKFPSYNVSEAITAASVVAYEDFTTLYILSFDENGQCVGIRVEYT
jgi:hypothetical protein